MHIPCELQTATCGSLLLQRQRTTATLQSIKTDGSSGGVGERATPLARDPDVDPSVGQRTSSTQRGPCREREIDTDMYCMIYGSCRRLLHTGKKGEK